MSLLCTSAILDKSKLTCGFGCACKACTHTEDCIRSGCTDSCDKKWYAGKHCGLGAISVPVPSIISPYVNPPSRVQSHVEKAFMRMLLSTLVIAALGPFGGLHKAQLCVTGTVRTESVVGLARRFAPPPAPQHKTFCIAVCSASSNTKVANIFKLALMHIGILC